MRYLILTVMILCTAIYAEAQQNTEIHGFYQGYRHFSWNTGVEEINAPESILRGGGFGVAQNLEPWFAFWTQFSFLGGVKGPMSVRIIDNLQGVRYQTNQFGPLRIYGKGGVGFCNYSIDVLGASLGGTRPSFGYGAGVQIWLGERIGVNLDASHVIMGLPNITNAPGRENWDSGLALTSSFVLRF